MADQVPQPAPACGLRAVHRRADAGRAEFEQRLGGVAVVARDESDGGDGGELAHETRDRRKLVAAASVDREDERVHPLAPGRPQGVPERAGVERRKAAVARSIEAGTPRPGQDGADGPHAGETPARAPPPPPQPPPPPAPPPRPAPPGPGPRGTGPAPARGPRRVTRPPPRPARACRPRAPPTRSSPPACTWCSSSGRAPTP